MHQSTLNSSFVSCRWLKAHGVHIAGERKQREVAKHIIGEQRGGPYGERWRSHQGRAFHLCPQFDQENS